MKPIYLIYSILIFVLFACNKDLEPEIPEDTTISVESIDVGPSFAGPEFPESIYGDYALYTLYSPYAMKCTCEESITSSVIAIDDNTISFQGDHYKFVKKNEENNTFHFFYSESIDWNYLYDDHDLIYYECSDSLAYRHIGDGDSIKKFGKRLGGKICESDIVPEEFVDSYCSQGPENTYCHSSRNLSIKWQRDISTLYYISSDIVSETLTIGIEYELYINLPTDSTLELLPGKYWIGETPPQDKSLLSISFVNPYVFSIGGDDFTEGFLEVTKSADEYIISFDLTCKGEGKWSGYYKGEII